MLSAHRFWLTGAFYYAYGICVSAKRYDVPFTRATVPYSLQLGQETCFQKTSHVFPLRPKLHCLPAAELSKKPENFKVDLVVIVLSGKQTPGPIAAVMSQVVTGTGDKAWVSLLSRFFLRLLQQCHAFLH